MPCLAVARTMDEKYLEQAAALSQMQRDTALHAASAAVAGPGQAECEDCAEPIPAARRVAFPAAIRCFYCQDAHEQQRHRFHAT
jgi:phage/conjugal plasmid C-4 type zinc finger TraR family protein